MEIWNSILWSSTFVRIKLIHIKKTRNIQSVKIESGNSTKGLPSTNRGRETKSAPNKFLIRTRDGDRLFSFPLAAMATCIFSQCEIKVSIQIYLVTKLFNVNGNGIGKFLLNLLQFSNPFSLPLSRKTYLRNYWMSVLKANWTQTEFNFIIKIHT